MDVTELLKQDVRYLKGVGEQRARLFHKLGVTDIGALLRTYPRSYLDMTKPRAVSDTSPGETCAVRVRITGKTPVTRVRGGKTICRVYACDDSGDMTVLFFNNRFTPASLHEGDEVVLYGRVGGNLIERDMTNPTVVKGDGPSALTPRYPLTEGLTQRAVASAVQTALSLLEELPETLPRAIVERYGLLSRDRAVRLIHMPTTMQEAADAKRRLIFEELLTLKTGMSLMKNRTRATTTVRIEGYTPDEFLASLPFSLTGAQRRCIDEIARDLAKQNPMSRLLQGDVGSGKTVVAAAGVYLAAKSGYQSAVMAPTEVLAEQHAATFSKLLRPFGIEVGLLTGSVKGAARRLLLEHIASGRVGLVVGTHALLSDEVRYHRLGFVTADEQHRFGVRQRTALQQKGEAPHLLVMSATPIPRTLALILYGDLDISVIDEMPPGRTPVKTLLVTDELRTRYLGFVRKTVEAGGAAYIVCPLVEDSEALEDTLSASEYAAELQENYLRGLRIGLVTGRMKPADKAAVMDAFRGGDLDVLVATTVIEVGVDVPRATLMIIENAERFGLSTLHQLRGRVGRGGGESYCVLVSSSDSATAQERLKIMTRTNSGFEIARHDLQNRGPGDFFGSRQHGLPELHVADLATDENVLVEAAQAAQELLTSDPLLERSDNAALRAQVDAMFRAQAGTFH